MAIKRPKPEEIVVKLRQVEVLMGQGMPDYQGSQDSAERAMDPQIVRFVDGSGNTRYRVSNQDFPTLYSAESYLDRLKFGTK